MDEIHITKLVPNLGVFLITFLLAASSFISTQKTIDTESVLGSSTGPSSVRITTVVQPREITIIVHPEKRIPPTGNWGTIAHFRILDCTTKAILHDFTNVTTDNTGTGVVTINPSDNLIAGTYAYSVKGFSHLNKHFACAPIMTAGTTLDFTPEGVVLAGDTSVVIDNYVNSLDISNNILNLFTSDYKNDLNQDTEVNSLDLSNIITNLFILGDDY